jgi:hypothetical protein
MKIIETEYWCLMLPPEWSAEQSEDVVVITDQDGIGELAVTTLIQDNASAGEASAAIVAEEESPEVADWTTVQVGPFAGVVGAFKEDGLVIREWYLTYRSALLYVTYACGIEDEGLDTGAVEEILGTLVPGDALL